MMGAPKNTCVKVHQVAYKLNSRGVLGRALAKIARWLNRVIFSCDIDCGAFIPSSCTFYHNGLGCVIHGNVQMGEGCTVFQGVTLGSAWRKGVCEDDAPTIGEGVLLGAGCCVLGNVRIGNGAIVGANAVVVFDVPENATVVGPVSKIHQYREKEEE